MFRVQMIGYSNSTAILKVIETKGTNCSMVDIGSRRDGICELVPLEMVMLEECARQRIESVVKCLQTKRLEDDTGVYFGFLMEDAGPRTISLAEFNAHDRPTLTAAEIQEIFVNVIIALDPLYKLGLYHGDLKGNNTSGIFFVKNTQHSDLLVPPPPFFFKKKEGNILINMDTLEVKIIDLGSCTPMIIPGHRMMGVSDKVLLCGNEPTNNCFAVLGVPRYQPFTRECAQPLRPQP